MSNPRKPQEDLLSVHHMREGFSHCFSDSKLPALMGRSACFDIFDVSIKHIVKFILIWELPIIFGDLEGFGRFNSCCLLFFLDQGNQKHYLWKILKRIKASILSLITVAERNSLKGVGLTRRLGGEPFSNVRDTICCKEVGPFPKCWATISFE